MGRESCRNKSAGTRLPVKPVKPAGKARHVLDVPRADAIRVFEARTGLVVREDSHLGLLMHWIGQGMAEAAKPATEQTELHETEAGAEAVPVATTRGRPPLPVKLTKPLVMLTNWLGPSDAALALFIHGLHPFGGAVTGDVRDALRRTQQRLSKLARAA